MLTRSNATLRSSNAWSGSYEIKMPCSTNNGSQFNDLLVSDRKLSYIIATSTADDLHIYIANSYYQYLISKISTISNIQKCKIVSCSRHKRHIFQHILKLLAMAKGPSGWAYGPEKQSLTCIIARDSNNKHFYVRPAFHSYVSI